MVACDLSTRPPSVTCPPLSPVTRPVTYPLLSPATRPIVTHDPSTVVTCAWSQSIVHCKSLTNFSHQELSC